MVTGPGCLPSQDTYRAEPAEWVPDERALAEMTPRMREQYERQHAPAPVFGQELGRGVFAFIEDDVQAFSLIRWGLDALRADLRRPFVLTDWPRPSLEAA